MAPTTAAKLAEVALRYGWAARAARDANPQRRFSFAGRRVNELDRIFDYHYGSILPDDDAGADDVFLMVHALARAHRDIRAWIASRAPWMQPEAINELIERVTAFPLKFRADTLGQRLGLTEAVRRLLGIRTIGSVDMTTAERKQARKLAARERDRARRRAREAKPRAEYLQANSLNREKPWEKEGVCRRTWERRRGRSPRPT